MRAALLLIPGLVLAAAACTRGGPVGEADARGRPAVAAGATQSAPDATEPAREAPQSAPGAPAADGRLSIAAASNLKFALDELAEAFEARHPGVRVQVTYGSSGKLAAQIEHGAPFDLFLSADRDYPDALAARGQTEGKPFVYALGRLVLWFPDGSPLARLEPTLDSLADPSVRRVAIANPKVAPYGRAAVEALERADVHADVQDRLVYGENISQAAQFAERGAADAALLPLSLARAPVLKRAGRYRELPDGTYPPLEQAGAVLKGAEAPGLARQFVALLLGPQGRRLLDAHGYAVPET